jgi:hypothetical protein
MSPCVAEVIFLTAGLGRSCSSGVHGSGLGSRLGSHQRGTLDPFKSASGGKEGLLSGGRAGRCSRLGANGARWRAAAVKAAAE